MQKITQDTLKDLPRSRISESVWAAVLGIAASYNAQADEITPANNEGELQDKLDEQKELKDEAAMVAMAGAGAGANENIVGDGTTVEHAGTEGGEITDTAEAQIMAKQAPLSTNDAPFSPTDNSPSATNQSVDGELSVAATAASATDATGETLADDSSDSILDSIMSSAEPIVAGMEFDTGLLALLGVAAVGVVAIAVNNDDDSSDNSSTPTPTPLTGTAIDGYVAGATVWADINGDGVQDAGETTITDSKGNFSFDNVPGGTTVSILPGGRDVMTGEIVNTTMTGSASSNGPIVVSPLTTLIANGADAAQLKASLGIDQSIDLATFDPVAAITSDDPAQQQLGESVFIAAQQVMTSLQAGVANGGTVNDIAGSLASNINAAPAGSDFGDAVNSTLGSDLGGVVNNANNAIADGLGGGNLASAISSGSFQTLADTMDVVAIAQTQLVNAVEQAHDSGTTIDAADWTPDAIETSASNWTPDLNADNFAFLIEQGLSLDGADIQITDADFLQTILGNTDSAGALAGSNIEIDNSLSDFTDQLAATTGNDVTVTDLGDY